jgi:hypothetical protein
MPDALLSIGIVDVPGHEDFVKNMVAGVGSIDLALLVVAADDGWMPQTEEHLQILIYLGVRRIVVALTKIDLVEAADAAEEKGPRPTPRYAIRRCGNRSDIDHNRERRRGIESAARRANSACSSPSAISANRASRLIARSFCAASELS